jgi:hypothetical protein
LHLGALSHLALLDDGIVVGTSQRTGMERVLALHAGEQRSFADGPGATLIAGAPSTIASGLIADGKALATVGESLLALSRNPNVAPDLRDQLATQVADAVAEAAEEAPRMPPIALVLNGIAAGVAASWTTESFPESQRSGAMVVVVPADTATAGTVAETAQRRLTTLAIPALAGDAGGGRPWAEVFPSIRVEVMPGGAVVIELEPAQDVPAGRLIDLQMQGLLSFLYWAE